MSYGAFLACWAAYNAITFEGLRSNATAVGASEFFGPRAAEIILAIRLAGLLVVPWLILFRASWWGVLGLLAVAIFWGIFLPDYLSAASDGASYAMAWLAAYALLFVSLGMLAFPGSRSWFRNKDVRPDLQDTFE